MSQSISIGVIDIPYSYEQRTLTKKGKHYRHHKLKLTAKGKFTPTGGKAVSLTTTFSLKLP